MLSKYLKYFQSIWNMCFKSSTFRNLCASIFQSTSGSTISRLKGVYLKCFQGNFNSFIDYLK